MTYSFPTKNTATYSTPSKNTASYTSSDNHGVVWYLMTDTPEFILVGSAEDETLILADVQSYSYPTKN